MRYLALFALSIILLTVVAGTVASTKPPVSNAIVLVTGFALTPQSIAPGETATANVTVTSENSLTAVSTTISFTAASPLSLVGTGSTFYIGNLTGTSSHSLTLQIGASQTAKPGVYPLPYTLVYQNSTGNRITSSGQVSVTILGAPPQPFLAITAISYSQSVIAPGTTFQTTLFVNNTGGTSAIGGVIAITPGSGVNLVASSGVVSLRTLLAGQGESVVFQMSAASSLPSGYIPVGVRLAFSDSNGVNYSDNSTFNVPLTSRPEVTVGSFALSVAPLRPGISSVLSLSLLNVAGDRAYDLSVTVTGAAFLTGSATNYLGSVAPGGSATAAFYLTVANTTKPGSQSLVLSIGYSDALGNQYNESNTYAINVGPYLPPSVSVTNILLDPPILTTGSQGTVTIFLSNTGPTEATNVKVSIANGTGLLTSNLFGLGTMVPGDQVTQVVGLSVNPSLKPQSRTLEVSVTYSDLNGKSYSTTVPYQTQIFESYNPFSLFNIAIVVGVVLLALVVLFVVRRYRLLESFSGQS